MITAAEREQLLRKAQIVANETETAANDANRIGTLFAQIIRALGDGATEDDIKVIIHNFGNGKPSSMSRPSASRAETKPGVMMWLCTSITP